MKYFSIALIFSSVLFLSSCQKCQDQDCQNGSTCSIENGTATCECTEFYSGERCEIETRSNYYGTYTGTYRERNDDNGSTSMLNPTFTVERYLSGASRFNIVMDSGNSSEVTFKCRLTDDTNFIIEGFSNSSYNIDGTGTISETYFTLSGTASTISSNSTSTISINATR